VEEEYEAGDKRSGGKRTNRGGENQVLQLRPRKMEKDYRGVKGFKGDQKAGMLQ